MALLVSGLIDPTNITIESIRRNQESESRIRTETIENSLDNGTDVTIYTSDGGLASGTDAGNITVKDSIRKTSGSSATLTLQADNDIIINDNITSSSDALNVNLDARNNININASIDTNGGDLTTESVNFTNNSTINLGSSSGSTIKVGRGGANSVNTMGSISLNQGNQSLSVAGNTGSDTFILNDSEVSITGDANEFETSSATYSSANKVAHSNSSLTLKGTELADNFTVGKNSDSEDYVSSNGIEFTDIATVDGGDGEDSVGEDASSEFNQAVLKGSQAALHFNLHKSSDMAGTSDIAFKNVETLTTANTIVNSVINDLTVQVYDGNLNLNDHDLSFKKFSGYQGSGTDNISDSNDHDWATNDSANEAVSNGITFSGIDRVTSTGALSSTSTSNQTVKHNGSREMELKGISFSGSATFNGDAVGDRVDTIEDTTTDSTWVITDDSDVSKDGQIFNDIDIVQTRNNVNGKGAESTWFIKGDNTALSNKVTFEFQDSDNIISNVGQIINSTDSDLTATLGADHSLTTASIKFADASSYLGLGDKVDTIIDNRGFDWSLTGNHQAETADTNNANANLITFNGIDKVTLSGQVTNNSANALTDVKLDLVTENNITSHTVDTGTILFTGATGYTGEGSDKVTDQQGRDWHLIGNKALNLAADDSLFKLLQIGQLTDANKVTNSSGNIQQVTLDAAGHINAGNIQFENTQTYAGAGLNDTIVDNRTTVSTWNVKGNKNASTQNDTRHFTGINKVTTTADVKNATASEQDVTVSFDDGENKDTISLLDITFIGSRRYEGNDSGTDNIIDNKNRTWYLQGSGTIDDQLDGMGFRISKVDKVQAGINIENGSGSELDVSIANTGQITAGDILFANATHYKGSGSDNLVDEHNLGWSVTGSKALNNSAQFLSGVDYVKTANSLTNSTGTEQTVTLTKETVQNVELNKLAVADITFEGNGGYTGLGFDNIADNTNSDWNLNSTNTVTQKSIGRTLSGIDSVATKGSVTESATNNWVTTADQSAQALNVTFTGTSLDSPLQITTAGRISSSLNSAQTVTADADSLELNKVDFVGATGFDGVEGRSDKVVDSSGENWSVTGGRAATRGSTQTFTQVARVETVGDITNSIGSKQTVTLNKENQKDTLTLANITFVGSDDYTGSGTDDITDSNNENWGIEGGNSASLNSGKINERLFTGISSVASTGKVSNATGADLTVTINKGASNTLSAQQILFTGLTGYTGDATATDTVNGTLGDTWYLTGNKRLNEAEADNGFLLADIDIVDAGITDLIHSSIYGGEVDVTVRSDSKISTEGILFNRLTSYTGKGQDNVVDERDQDWTIADWQKATSGDGNSLLTFSGIDKITTSNNTKGKSTDSTWSVKDNLSASSEGITFAFQHSNGNVPEISNVGTVTNATSSGKEVTLNNDQILSLSVAGIKFADAEGYAGHSDQTDTVVDSTNKGWNLDSDHAASQVISNADKRTFTNISKVSTTGDITETATNSWVSTGDNSAKALNVTFDGTSKITTDGRISSEIAADQTVTVNDSDLTLNGVAFTGSVGFDGSSNVDYTDTIDDNRTTATQWSISGTNAAASGVLTFSNIDEVSTAGNVDGQNDNSAWSIEGTKQAKSDDILFTLEGAAPEIVNVGEVTNNTNGNLAVTLNSDGTLSTASLKFMDATGYTGLSGNNDSVIDDRGLGWTITDDYQARSEDSTDGKLITFSNINAISNAKAVVDSQNSDWSVGSDNMITTATDGKITLTGATSVESTGTLTNSTGSDQNVTLGDDNGTETTFFDDLALTFRKAGSYVGNGGDNITDTTSSNWEITNTGANQNTRSFSGIDHVAMDGDVSNASAGLEISLGQVNDNGSIKQSIATSNITFTGVKNYAGSGTDIVTDTVTRDWYLTGTKTINTLADSSGMGVSGLVTAKSFNSVHNQALDNLDVTIVNDGSLTAAGINFTDAKAYTGSGNDNVTDQYAKDWLITGTNAANSGQLSFAGIDQVSTAANAQGQTTDSSWSVKGDRSAESDGITFGFTGADTRITNVGSVTNSSMTALGVELKADSSLQLASMNFADASGFKGTNLDSITDSRGVNWTITDTNDASTGNTTDGNLVTFEGINQVATSADVQGKLATSAWTIEGLKSASSDAITFNFTDADTNITHAGSVANGTGSSLTWHLQSTDQEIAAADMKFQGVSTITGYSDGKGNADTINATANNDIFTVTGNESLETKGIAFSNIRMILAGNGTDSVISSAMREWELGGTLNQILVEGMTFTDVENAEDRSNSGALKGSSSDDTITWLGNRSINAEGVSFSGFTAIDGGDGNDFVSIQGEVDSLTTLVGGAGNGDTLENTLPSLGWKLLSTETSLGGQHFSAFENLAHTASTLSVISDSNVSLDSRTVATDFGNVAIDSVSRFDDLTLGTDKNISGQVSADVLNMKADNINVETSGDVTINEVVATGNVDIEALTGNMLVDTITAEGNTVILKTNAGDLLAVDKNNIGYNITARDVDMSAIGFTISSQATPFHIQSEIGGSVNYNASEFYSPRIYVNDVLTDNVTFTYFGNRLLNIFELGDLAASKTESQDVVNQLGNIDPAVFTAINSFSIAENSIEEPVTGDYLLVESGYGGLGVIENLPIEATAAGDEFGSEEDEKEGEVETF